MLGDGDEVTRYSNGSGWFGFVDVRPGQYLVTVDLPFGVVGKPVDLMRVVSAEAQLAPLIALR